MYEINLVPDIKAEMIRAQKLRNVVLFFCILIGAAALGVIFVLATIKGGQDIRMSAQDKQLNDLSDTVASYNGIDELLTVQSQLQYLDEIGQNKKMLSRVFGIIDILKPTTGDDIKFSALDINLETSTVSFDAQADAKVEPLIDYRVLESFQKGIPMMRYDYGRYVNENGKQIPTRCIVESKPNGGGTLVEEDGSIYAMWTRGVAGCDPEDPERATGVGDEKIWRTPRFTEWYNSGNMSADGVISNVPHFESRCISYQGASIGGVMKWASNNSCVLAENGINITSSSNGKNADGELVLRFSARININPAFFAYGNKHVLAIAPTGKVNVTDSYIQVDGMFEERAVDCEEGACAEE